MRIRLIRKFAEIINGVDLTQIAVGDIVDLNPRAAILLVAERWAEYAEHSSTAPTPDSAEADSVA